LEEGRHRRPRVPGRARRIPLHRHGLPAEALRRGRGGIRLEDRRGRDGTEEDGCLPPDEVHLAERSGSGQHAVRGRPAARGAGVAQHLRVPPQSADDVHRLAGFALAHAHDGRDFEGLEGHGGSREGREGAVAGDIQLLRPQGVRGIVREGQCQAEGVAESLLLRIELRRRTEENVQGAGGRIPVVLDAVGESQGAIDAGVEGRGDGEGAVAADSDVRIRDGARSHAVVGT